MKIIVTGASGFLGSHTVKALVDAGHCVVGLSRSLPSEARAVEGAEYIAGVDVAEGATLKLEYFDGVDTVVHLVGIIQERQPKQTFRRVHVGGTTNVVEKAAAAGVKKILYMSAIGSAEEAPAEYSQTKAMAEKIVIGSSLDYTILRPSIILGKDGEFVAQMQDLVRSGGLPIRLPFPFIPVPGSGDNLFQPIYVDDLTSCIEKAVHRTVAPDSIVEVGGATQVSFNELLDVFAASLQIKKPKLHAPIAILMLVAPLMGILPNPPVTRDQLKNLSRDNICDLAAMKEVFGINPIPFEESMARIYEKPQADQAS